jgi:hypothetical protein
VIGDFYRESGSYKFKKVDKIYFTLATQYFRKALEKADSMYEEIYILKKLFQLHSSKLSMNDDDTIDQTYNRYF